MKWTLIFNNSKGIFPTGWLLTDALNFIEFMKKSINVETIIFSNGVFHGAEIEHNNDLGLKSFREKKIDLDPLDGIIISMSLPGIQNVITNENILKEFLDILQRLKPKRPLIFCSASPIFNEINNMGILKDLNVVFVQRIAIRWFNLHLKQIVKNYYLNKK